ncbi:fumarylacetoacetate hydrolase family protein [Pseudoneobacillus sp. C159]
MDRIRNIYCVGRNYESHAKELKNEVPTYPMFFSKPTHSLVEADGQEIHLPSNRGPIHYEVEWVVGISKSYEKGMQVDELVDGMALGIDFTLRDVQSELKKRQHPWLLAKGFPNSAIVTPFIDFPGVEKCQQFDFSLWKNGEQVQRGNIRNMIFNLQTVIEYCGLHFGLGKGDIIFTGTPEGVGPVTPNDHYTLNWGPTKLGEFSVSLV